MTQGSEVSKFLINLSDVPRFSSTDGLSGSRQVVATNFNALQSRSSPVHEPVFKHLVQGVLALLTSLTD